jgi:mannosyltransferase OCH1-like enzyme
MAIPKTIYQTYKTSKLPWLTRWHIKQMLKKNPEYDYQFYDNDRVSSFIKDNFDEKTYSLYCKINIGACKADFFRYAILYKKGGVYLDIDSLILKKLDDFILPEDKAIITKEKNEGLLVQWGLIFEAQHPFLKRTLDLIIDNLEHNRFPFDVHKMTGPTAFTQAVNECRSASDTVQYRMLGVDYNGFLKFSYPLSKLMLYGIFKSGHWKKEVIKKAVLKS